MAAFYAWRPRSANLPRMGPHQALQNTAKSSSLWRDRRLWILIGVAALLRLAIGVDLWLHDPTTRALLSDSSYYYQWAGALSGGADFAFENPGQPFWMPPLYPYLLSVLFPSIKGMLFAQGVVGLGTLALLVRFSERLLATALSPESTRRVTLYAPVIYFENRLLGVTVALFLATLTLDLLLGLLRRPALRLAVIAGVTCGLLALIRPNTLLSIPAVAIAMYVATRTNLPTARPRLALVASFCAAALLTLAPALAKNHAAEGEWIPLTANSGVNFYFGNNPEAHGTFHAPGPEWGAIEAQRSTSIRLAEAALGRKLTHGEASDYWYDQAFEWLASNPVNAAQVVALKLADSLSSTEFGIQYNLRASREVAPTLWSAPLPFGLLLFLAALGIVRIRATQSEFKAEGLLLGSWLAAGLLGALLFFTYSRFRLPLLPTLFPLAGLGAMALFGAHKPKPKALALSALLLVQSLIPFEGTYTDHLRSHAFVDMAHAVEANAIARRETDSDKVRAEASALLMRALAITPGNKPALVMLARLLSHSDPTAALDAIERAALLPITYPLADYWLARLLIETPLPDRSDKQRAVQIAQNWLLQNGQDHDLAGDFQQLIQWAQ
jgi:hypothetical protein